MRPAPGSFAAILFGFVFVGVWMQNWIGWTIQLAKPRHLFVVTAGIALASHIVGGLGLFLILWGFKSL